MKDTTLYSKGASTPNEIYPDIPTYSDIHKAADRNRSPIQSQRTFFPVCLEQPITMKPAAL